MPSMIVLGDQIVDIISSKIPLQKKYGKIYKVLFYIVVILTMLVFFQYMLAYNYNGVVPYQNNITWN